MSDKQLEDTIVYLAARAKAMEAEGASAIEVVHARCMVHMTRIMEELKPQIFAVTAERRANKDVAASKHNTQALRDYVHLVAGICANIAASGISSLAPRAKSAKLLIPPLANDWLEQVTALIDGDGEEPGLELLYKPDGTPAPYDFRNDIKKENPDV